jgi:hypothetical protein
MVGKREYRDRVFLILGLIFGSCMGFLGSIFATEYSKLRPDFNFIIFASAFFGFIFLLILLYIIMIRFYKKT